MTIEQVETLARDVYCELGTGHAEIVYQKAMEVGLRVNGVPYEAQRDVPVMFMGHYVGRGIADLVLSELTIELKSVGFKIGAGDVAQIKNYMSALGTQVGLIINFGQPGRNQDGELSTMIVTF